MFPSNNSSRQELSFIKDGTTIIPSRTLTDGDFDEIRRYLIHELTTIKDEQLLLDFSNNSFSSSMADKVEEEAIVKRGVLLDKIKCESTSKRRSQHFFAFLKEKVFKLLEEQEIIEAAEAILYINQELVTYSESSGGPFSEGELTQLANASRESIKDFFVNNSHMAFRLYMWFHMHRQEVEEFYRQKRKDLHEGKQKRWKEIRQQVFEQKLQEVDSSVDEGDNSFFLNFISHRRRKNCY